MAPQTTDKYEFIIDIDSDNESDDELPCYTRSIELNDRQRCRLFLESDQLIAGYGLRYDVNITDCEKKGTFEVTGKEENVHRCMEKLEEMKKDEKVHLMKMDLNVGRKQFMKMTEKRDEMAMKMMETNDVFFILPITPSALSTKITIFGRHSSEIFKTINEIEALETIEEVTSTTSSSSSNWILGKIPALAKLFNFFSYYIFSLGNVIYSAIARV